MNPITQAKGVRRRVVEVSEREIQRAICRLLALAGVPYTVTDAALVVDARGRVRRGVRQAGWPDITACLPPQGRLWAIEVKSPRGRLRPVQKACLSALERAGALVTVARSVDDVAQILRLNARCCKQR